MKFHIVSDSSCDLGRERAQQLGVTLVSFYVAFEGDPYRREERDVTSQEFYRMMAERPGEFPRTSMPTVEDYLEAFEPQVRAGMPVLCICLNGDFSGSLQGARNARDVLLEEYPDADIHVMDSQLATVLQGLLVEQAAALRDRGCTLEETVAELGDKPIYFTVDLDVMDPSVFPGTGTPEPGGVTFEALRKAVTLVCSRCNVVGCDVNELSPPYDPSGVSNAVAAKVVREMLLALEK